MSIDSLVALIHPRHAQVERQLAKAEGCWHFNAFNLRDVTGGAAALLPTAA